MILNIYKPPGPTSHDIVDRVRKITGERKVGHAGTLDPFAEGVLVIGVGRENTKKLGGITKNTQKEYVAVIELGKTSDTGDPTGEIIDTDIYGLKRIDTDEKLLKSKQGIRINPSKSALIRVLKKFKGEIEQVPPAYSAIKIKGEPAYKKARRGEKVELPKRKVTIHYIELMEYKPPFLKIKVVCSAGTYIRTLAEDIGKKLGTGAYVKKLVRTKVGNYKIENAITLDKLRDGFLSP